MKFSFDDIFYLFTSKIDTVMSLLQNILDFCTDYRVWKPIDFYKDSKDDQRIIVISEKYALIAMETTNNQN